MELEDHQNCEEIYEMETDLTEIEALRYNKEFPNVSDDRGNARGRAKKM